MSRCVSSRRWVVAITTSLALIGIASPLAAQDDGPVVITKKQEFKWFKLDLSRTHVTLDIYGRREIDEVTPRGEDKRRDTEDRLTEELKFETEGFIGHPNFIKLELSAGIRLRQEWIESDTLDTDDNTEENLNEYDVSALILQEGDAPFTLYSRRTQNTIDRQFAGSLDSTLTEHGAMLRLKSDTLPSFFNYFHREQEQTSLQGVSDFDLVQDTFQWQSQFKPGEGQLLTWDYTYDNVDESGALRGSNQFERHDAIATHNWSFGKREHPNNLRSVLTYYKETGRFPLERIRLDESLDLRHTRNFETRYDYLFQKQTPTKALKPALAKTSTAMATAGAPNLGEEKARRVSLTVARVRVPHRSRSVARSAIQAGS